MRDGWIETTVSHLLECSIGGVWGSDPGTSEVDVCVYRQTEFDDDGKLTMPSEAIRSMTRSQLKSRALQPGDVLMQKSAGTPSLPGRVVRVRDGIENDATCSNFLQLLRADQSICNSDYLFWLLWMGHRTGRAFEFQRGTNIRNLDLNQYLIQPVLLPPLQEQKRIVDVVSAVDEYIAALQRQAYAARTARNAVLHELLTTGGDDWVETTLGEIAEIEMGQSPPGDSYNVNAVGLPFMQGSAEFGEHYPTPIKWCSAPAKVAEPGDVLLSVRAPVGDTNIANQRIAIGRGLASLRGKRGAMTPFLRLELQKSVQGLLSNSGSGMFSSITGRNLREFKLKVPPLPEQERIVGIVSSMDDVIRATESAIVESKNLRSGLLSDLLSGQHEIPASYDRLLSAA